LPFFGQTRVNDAVLPDELPRFSQVGGGGGDKRVCIGANGQHITHAGNQEEFGIIFGWAITSMVGELVEAENVITWDWGLTIKRIYLQTQSNTKNANTILAFRDDGVTVASITIAASTTGEADSGDLTVLVASGSLINWMLDTSLSASGVIGEMAWNAQGFET